MVKFKVNTAAVLTFLVFAFLAYNYLFFTDYIPISPDENSYLFFSENFVKNGSFSHSEKLNIEYNTNIFVPRNAVYSTNTQVVAPQGFLGSFLVFNVLSLFIKLKFLFPFLGLIGIIFLFNIVKINSLATYYLTTLF